MQIPSGSYELLRYEIMQTARNFPWIRSLLMAPVAILVAGCGPPHPNVLLVTFDTARYDRLGCTGDPEARTPVVDGLAERGLLSALGDPDPAVVLAAIDALEFAGDESIAPRLEKLGAHPNPAVRVAAVEAAEFLR